MERILEKKTGSQAVLCEEHREYLERCGLSIEKDGVEGCFAYLYNQGIIDDDTFDGLIEEVPCLQTRENFIYMNGSDIPSIILHLAGFSRRIVMDKRVYAYDKNAMTLSPCPNWVSLKDFGGRKFA